MKAKQNTTKRYYHTQSKDFILPDDFVYSRNKKYIVVQYCGAVVNQHIVGDLMVHSDIVEFMPFCDHFIMLANRRQTKYRKYECLNNTKKEYRLWFTDMKGNVIEPESFIFSCLLIY